MTEIRYMTKDISTNMSLPKSLYKLGSRFYLDSIVQKKFKRRCYKHFLVIKNS